MVSTNLDVARCEGRIDPSDNAGESKRQEDRRGTLAVKSGPPTRGCGGVADSLRPLQVDACGPPVRRPDWYYRPDPPRVERHSASPALFLSPAGSWAPPGEQGPSLPGTPRGRLTYAGWEVLGERRGCPLPGENRNRRTHWP